MQLWIVESFHLHKKVPVLMNHNIWFFQTKRIEMTILFWIFGDQICQTWLNWISQQSKASDPERHLAHHHARALEGR